MSTPISPPLAPEFSFSSVQATPGDSTRGDRDRDHNERPMRDSGIGIRGDTHSMETLLCALELVMLGDTKYVGQLAGYAKM